MHQTRLITSPRSDPTGFIRLQTVATRPHTVHLDRQRFSATSTEQGKGEAYAGRKLQLAHPPFLPAASWTWERRYPPRTHPRTPARPRPPSSLPWPQEARCKQQSRAGGRVVGRRGVMYAGGLEGAQRVGIIPGAVSSIPSRATPPATPAFRYPLYAHTPHAHLRYWLRGGWTPAQPVQPLPSQRSAALETYVGSRTHKHLAWVRRRRKRGPWRPGPGQPRCLGLYPRSAPSRHSGCSLGAARPGSSLSPAGEPTRPLIGCGDGRDGAEAWEGAISWEDACAVQDGRGGRWAGAGAGLVGQGGLVL
jgi:hypothetical protein